VNTCLHISGEYTVRNHTVGYEVAAGRIRKAGRSWRLTNICDKICRINLPKLDRPTKLAGWYLSQLKGKAQLTDQSLQDFAANSWPKACCGSGTV
jgi:hypothetical protein